MNPDDLIRLLDELGKRLGPSGEYVFRITIAQVISEAIVWLVVIAIVPLLLWVTTAVLARKAVHADNADDFWGEMATFVGMLAVLATGVGLYLAAQNVIHLLNPEFAAIERIVVTLR